MSAAAYNLSAIIFSTFHATVVTRQTCPVCVKPFARGLERARRNLWLRFFSCVITPRIDRCHSVNPLPPPSVTLYTRSPTSKCQTFIFTPSIGMCTTFYRDNFLFVSSGESSSPYTAIVQSELKTLTFCSENCFESLCVTQCNCVHDECVTIETPQQNYGSSKSRTIIFYFVNN